MACGGRSILANDSRRGPRLGSSKPAYLRRGWLLHHSRSLGPINALTLASSATCGVSCRPPELPWRGTRGRQLRGFSNFDVSTDDIRAPIGRPLLAITTAADDVLVLQSALCVRHCCRIHRTVGGAPRGVATTRLNPPGDLDDRGLAGGSSGEQGRSAHPLSWRLERCRVLRRSFSAPNSASRVGRRGRPPASPHGSIMIATPRRA